jgi:hypothetical protein
MVGTTPRTNEAGLGCPARRAQEHVDGPQAQSLYSPPDSTRAPPKP